MMEPLKNRTLITMMNMIYMIFMNGTLITMMNMIYMIFYTHNA